LPGVGGYAGAVLLVPFVAFFVLAGVFWAIEGRFAALPEQARWREGSRTDLFYWLFNPLVTKLVRRVAGVLAVVSVAIVTGTQLRPGEGVTPLVEGSWVSSQPLWVQILGLILVADALGYWIHRLFHRGRLWSFHAIHHSSALLDWLASVRVHPVNDALGGVMRAIPLLLLGFDPLVVAGLVPLLGLHGLLLHANVPWSFGPLGYLVSSPRFHRWHHAQLDELPEHHQGRGGVNFGGLLPVFDLIFGTFHMPADEQPRRFGVDEAIPPGLWGQLRWPFAINARDRDCIGGAEAANPAPTPETAGNPSWHGL
jgi:sterol desaturase/sphingolipid hydroxylase (fatty acid hydroxylase superfamily)